MNSQRIEWQSSCLYVEIPLQCSCSPSKWQFWFCTSLLLSRHALFFLLLLLLFLLFSFFKCTKHKMFFRSSWFGQNNCHFLSHFFILSVYSCVRVLIYLFNSVFLYFCACCVSHCFPILYRCSCNVFFSSCFVSFCFLNYFEIVAEWVQMPSSLSSSWSLPSFFSTNNNGHYIFI